MTICVTLTIYLTGGTAAKGLLNLVYFNTYIISNFIILGHRLRSHRRYLYRPVNNGYLCSVRGTITYTLTHHK